MKRTSLWEIRLRVARVVRIVVVKRNWRPDPDVALYRAMRENGR